MRVYDTHIYLNKRILYVRNRERVFLLEVIMKATLLI